MKATIALFLIGMLSACLIGCATTGRPYDDGKIAMIKKDATTEAELVDWFGPPSARTLAPDGTKMLSWRFPSAQRHATGSSAKLEVRLGTGWEGDNLLGIRWVEVKPPNPARRMAIPSKGSSLSGCINGGRSALSP